MRWLAIIGFVAGFAFAQNQPELFDPLNDPVLIQRGLQSTTPLQVAVAASRAINQNSDAIRQALRAALANSESFQPEPERARARRILLEALIKTSARVPVDELLPFYDEFPGAVIAIVVHHRDEPEDSLALLRKAEEEQNPIHWRAVVSITGRSRNHYLVERARFDYPITLYDDDFLPVRIYGIGIPDGAPHGVIVGGILGTVSTGSIPRIQWPEETVYRIEAQGGPGELLTTGNLGDTYLKAWPQSKGYMRDRPEIDHDGWANHDREVVRALLPSIRICSPCVPGPDFSNLRGGKATIIWHSPEQALPILKNAIDTLAGECISLAAFVEEPLADKMVRSKIRVWIRDFRRERTPLPSVISGVQINVCPSYHAGPADGRCNDEHQP
ncbi:MAG TPA: hypothetical protein VKT81_21145 [Bryobacteraceae bacterium]|nr:hypothetical protein [Bryobacteraceae bacterium]